VFEIDPSLLTYLKEPRVRSVVLVVESPLSLDEARHALIAATREAPPRFEFFWQFAPYGVVEDDEFHLLNGDDERVCRGVIHGKLRGEGSHVRAQVLVSEEPLPILAWIVLIAILILSVWAASQRLWPDLGRAGEIALAAALVGVYAFALFLALRTPFGPSGQLVAQAKKFLSRALLAEPIEVETRAR